jgi:membrane protein YqaA with SNARE-associated domain
MMTFAWPYGTLFAVAFAAATLLPAQSEALLAGLLASNRYDPWLLLAVATAGNTLGSVVNWGIGRLVESFRESRWFPVSPKNLQRAEGWYRRWGIWSLLLSWAPIVGDALTIVAGMLRVRLPIFVALVLIAKASRYLVVAYLVIVAAG